MTSAPSSAPLPSEGDRRVDPSMEEILASIRRIIADDESPVLRGPLRAADEPPRSAPPRIEDLRPAAVVTPIVPVSPGPPRPTPVFGLSRPPATAGVQAPAPARPDPVRAVPSPEPEPSRDASAVRARPEPVIEPPTASVETRAPSGRADPPAAEPGALVSADTTTSVSSAFQALSASVALTAGDAIDRHVREMLRPLLRTWLDDNLPTIVEKLVRVEIERVARGGR